MRVGSWGLLKSTAEMQAALLGGGRGEVFWKGRERKRPQAKGRVKQTENKLKENTGVKLDM